MLSAAPLNHALGHTPSKPCAIAVLPLVVTAMLAASIAWGQRRPVHYFHSSDLPPGTVGQGQLLRGGPLPGYFQPVEIQASEGVAISLAVNGHFQTPREAPVLVGMLIGQVYRLRVTQIPRHEGFEVFPTIELVNRLYPPRGLENHFPIPIQLTLQELEMALSGRFVTRVIYLEDPSNPLPVADAPDRQRYYDVRSDQDALKEADRLGRPMAILRMGSRTPTFDAVSNRFLFASPPFRELTRPAPLPDPKSGLEDPIPATAGSRGGRIPRIEPLGLPTRPVAAPAAWWGRQP